MNDKVSYQSNITNPKNLWTYSIEEIYDFIKSGSNRYTDIREYTRLIQSEPSHDKQNILKMEWLPYATFNGVFSYRNDSSLLEYSRYTAIDFDKFQSETELQNIGYWLTQTPFVKFFFRSPSGKGLKAIIEHTNTNPKKHRALYRELLDVFKVPEIDQKTFDISRATFLCHDPFAWRNPECKAYVFDESKYPEGAASAAPSDCQVSLAGDYDEKLKLFDALKRPEGTMVTDASIKRIVGSWIDKDSMGNGRNNALYQYACTMCKGGVNFKAALWMLNEKFTSRGLGEDEIKKTVCNAYWKCMDQFGSERDSKFKKE